MLPQSNMTYNFITFKNISTEAFHNGSLRGPCGISWPNKITTLEINREIKSKATSEVFRPGVWFYKSEPSGLFSCSRCSPSVREKTWRRRDFHPSSCLFVCVCVDVATLIAIETHSRGSERKWAASMISRLWLNECVCMFPIVLKVLGRFQRVFKRVPWVFEWIQMGLKWVQVILESFQWSLKVLYRPLETFKEIQWDLKVIQQTLKTSTGALRGPMFPYRAHWRGSMWIKKGYLRDHSRIYKHPGGACG